MVSQGYDFGRIYAQYDKKYQNSNFSAAGISPNIQTKVQSSFQQVLFNIY
jgi:hypothetical protein